MAPFALNLNAIPVGRDVRGMESGVFQRFKDAFLYGWENGSDGCAMILSRFLLALALVVCASAQAGITIGAGPKIGTDKRGTDWFQEFQDWTSGDLRALDQNGDQHLFSRHEVNSDASRDLVAFYSREEGDTFFFRLDFFDIGFEHQNWAVDTYVAIDCAAGGQEWLPDFSDTRLAAGAGWEVCVGVYNSTTGSVYTKDFANIGANGNYLGSYWRSDLDAVEFGIKKSVLTAGGWDGASPLRFWVYTTRDGTDGGAGEVPGSDVVDVIGGVLTRQSAGDANTGVISGAGILSTASTSRAKYAAIAHANQSVATVDGTQKHIYTNRTDLDLHAGFIRTIDTHEMLGVPLNMHLSGSLLSSLLWARQDPAAPGYPERDGPTFVNRLKNLVSHGGSSIIGGVYAEHIMPYFEGEVNRASIRAFNDLANHIFGWSAGDMKVMHIPERVFHTNTSWEHANPQGPLKGQPFADIVAGGYAAAYLDEVTHLHWWFYPNEQQRPGWDDNNFGRWAGGSGNDEEPYHHKLHKIHGVLTFMLNDREDQSKFGNDDGGMMRDTRYTLLQKALSPDASQITIVFDDWEAFAGNSFASDTPNNNADQWHRTIRWAANHPWIEIKNLKDVVGWAQSDPSWVIDQGTPDGKTTQTYEWLKRASEHSYDNWYYGSNLEESFFGRKPMVWPNRGVPASIKAYGDMNTPGTLVRDSWDKIAGMPESPLRRLAEWTYSAMVYETAWHDEDANPDQYQSRNYQTTFNRLDSGITSYEDTTSDPVSYWALRLHGHIRKVGIMADAAQWANRIRTGTQGSPTLVEAKDVDDDTQDEYILKNNHAYLCFERWGARLLYAFVYDPSSESAVQVVGVPVSNPSEEHEGEGSDNNRCSGFKDRYASGPNDNRYVDMDYASTAPLAGTDFWEFRSEDGKITKRLRLAAGRDIVDASYSLDASVGTLYMRHGFGPNQMDLLLNGPTNLTTHGDGYYYGLANSQGGEIYTVRGKNTRRISGALPGAGYANRELPLTEQVEIENTAPSFTTHIAFSKASAEDVDGDGLPNHLEQAVGGDFENPDTDGDGMADGFEATHHLLIDSNDASADPDGDGRSNLSEYLAGTNPKSAASILKITSSAFSSANREVTLNWASVDGRKYKIQHKGSLAETTWTDIANHTASGNQSSKTVTAPQGDSNGFYRIATAP